ncbi:TetR/AcrR family transcriptional regulator [Labrenzia sp. 011]|uniref:TetR/AcrR family transcriptional regulator n=1 Tax=Labrenzia sp. 011 TaxID=2171494 RepID=UPI001403D109|nr:TetR/AcrR family transcriptional regulator [Labrenzia sp. 011]
MESESTRQRLLSNAERLMAEKGIAATSVREITDASEANVAAVNYYFGSKTELLLEILKRRFLQLDAELLERLNAVTARNNTTAPDIAELTGAYFDALVNLGFDPRTGRRDPFIYLIQRASSEQEAVLTRAQDYTAPGISRLIGLLLATTPQIDREMLQAPVLIGLMFTTSVDAMEAMAAEESNPALVGAIRAFLVAGVKAYLSRLETTITSRGA